MEGEVFTTNSKSNLSDFLNWRDIKIILDHDEKKHPHFHPQLQRYSVGFDNSGGIYCKNSFPWLSLGVGTVVDYEESVESKAKSKDANEEKFKSLLVFWNDASIAPYVTRVCRFENYFYLSQLANVLQEECVGIHSWDHSVHRSSSQVIHLSRSARFHPTAD